MSVRILFSWAFVRFEPPCRRMQLLISFNIVAGVVAPVVQDDELSAIAGEAKRARNIAAPKAAFENSLESMS